MKSNRTKPVIGTKDYRALLRRELRARQLHNPAYSQRAFARDLDLLPGRLNEILMGAQGLSPGRADQVAKRLELSKEEASYFVDLVRTKHARSVSERKKAQERLAAWRSDHDYRELQLSAFQTLSDWLPFAILELIKTRDFQPKTSWIARRLNVSGERVAHALRNLERLELLKREGDRWTALVGNTSVMKGVPSRTVKSFHRQVLQKGLDALYRQQLEQREFSSLVLALDRRRLPELKTKLREFVREIDREFGTASGYTDVACFASQLFFLTEKDE